MNPTRSSLRETLRLTGDVARLEGFVLGALGLSLSVAAVASDQELWLAVAATLLGLLGASVATRKPGPGPAQVVRGLAGVALVAGALVSAPDLDHLLVAWLVILSIASPFLVGRPPALAVPASAAVVAAGHGLGAAAPVGAISLAVLIAGLGVGTLQLRAVYVGDLRRMRAAMGAAQDRERYAAAVLEGMPHPSAVVGGDGMIHVVNAAWRELVADRGLASSLGGRVSWVCGTLFAGDPHAATRITDGVEAVVRGEADRFELDVRIDGTQPVWHRVTATPLPRPGGAILAVTDITPQVEHRSLVHRVHHDDLTGLPNRTRFAQALSATVQEANRTGEHVAVVFIDLDRFKQVNDSFGHAVGDGLLRAVATRLRTVLRPGDLLARLSGDEFAAICRHQPSPGVDRDVAARLRAAFDRPFVVDGRELRVGASVGVASTAQLSTLAPADLLARADEAMYRAKRAGRPAPVPSR